ncbi:hypothetical protein Tco_0363731 [Tanacetum coccineum]
MVGNLCTIWIGRLHLHANVVCFERARKPYNSGGFEHSNVHAPSGPYVTAVKGNTPLNVPSTPPSSVLTLVLDDSSVIERVLSRHVMGSVKDLNSIPNLRTLLTKEGFPEDAVQDFVSDERVVWVDIEGIQLNVWFRETFLKIGKKWGETRDIEDNLDSSFAQNVCALRLNKLIIYWRSLRFLHQRLHLLANARRNIEKALNILHSAIPDRHLRCHEHEFKGVSNSSVHQHCLSVHKSQGSNLKQSTAEPTNIPKGYTQAASSKYQENRANGRQEKKTVAIEDSNSKALVATDNNEDIDWTKEFDAEPTTFAMMALTEVEKDDWSMEFDAEHVHFGQDGLGDFDWSNKDDDTPVSLALMATNSEVPYCSKCSKSYKLLLENYQKERDNFQRARTEILGYQMSLESLEVILKTHEKNEYAWGDKYEQMEYDLKIRDLKLEEKQKELDQALKERDDFKVKLEKWSNASVLQNEVLNKQRYVSDKSCIGFGIESSNSMESDISSGDETLTDSAYENFKREKAYKAVPPPTGTIIPPRANVSFTGIDELAIRNKVVNQEKTKSSQSAIDRNKVIIEDWVDSDDEETDVSESQKETAFNSENSETSFENRSPNSQNSVGQESRTKGLGNKGGKLCFVCYSPNHLIKDCNLHERTFKQTQTHKPKGTQGSRETRPVWNNIQRVNHSNFSRNSRYPHQRRSFIPSAVLTRDGLISTARPKMTQTVPSKSTANVTYQGTARSRVPQAVLSRSTDGSYYPRMDNRRPIISSYSPSSRSSTTRTPHRPQRPKKIVKSIWVKKGSIVGSQAVLPQTGHKKGSRQYFKPTSSIVVFHIQAK